MGNAKNKKNQDQENIKPRKYKEVFEADFKDDKKSKVSDQGFGKEYKNLDQLYKYCRSKKGDHKGYDAIIRSIVGNEDKRGDDEQKLMNIINFIALWKTNRIIEFQDPSKISSLFKQLLKAKSDDIDGVGKELLSELLKKENKGIDLPTASTILHFYRPDSFPIIDRRAHRALYEKYVELNEILKPKGLSEPDTTSKKYEDCDEDINLYFRYKERCKELVDLINDKAIKMENIDQFLYQIDKLSCVPLSEHKIK